MIRSNDAVTHPHYDTFRPTSAWIARYLSSLNRSETATTGTRSKADGKKEGTGLTTTTTR